MKGLFQSSTILLLVAPLLLAVAMTTLFLLSPVSLAAGPSEYQPSPIVDLQFTNASTLPQQKQTKSHYLFGTLETDPTKASQEYAAGVRVAMQTIGWKDYEPANGVFNEAYMADVKNRITMDLAAGLKVVISPAIHYPPGWVMNLPGARYVNQYGLTAPLTWAGGFEEPNSPWLMAQGSLKMTHVMAQNPQSTMRRIHKSTPGQPSDTSQDSQINMGCSKAGKIRAMETPIEELHMVLP
jgi:hypothetical protein